MYTSILVLLLIPLVLSQFVSQEYYLDNSCTQSYLQTISIADNQCITSLYVDTSYIASCYPGSNYSYTSCNTRECISNCSTISSIPLTCIEMNSYYTSTRCLSVIPNQPVDTYIIGTYSGTNTCNGIPVSASLYTLDICSGSDGSYNKYSCDDKYVYQYSCSDAKCNTCTTPTVLWNDGCTATDKDSIQVVCIPNIPEISTSTSEGNKHIPLVVVSIAIIVIILWYST